MITPEEIITLVSIATGVPVSSIIGHTRKREVCEARIIAIYLVRINCEHLTLIQIGEYFGFRHYTTIIFALKQFNALWQFSYSFKRKFYIVRDFYLDERLAPTAPAPAPAPAQQEECILPLSIPSMETIKQLPAGDRAQLVWIRDRWNYLFGQKWQLIEEIEAKKRQGKEFAVLALEVQKLTDEMKQIDGNRTNIFLTRTKSK